MQATMRQRVEQFAADRGILDFDALVEFGAGSPTAPQRAQIQKDLDRQVPFARAW